MVTFRPREWIVFTGVSFDRSLGFGWLEAIHPDDRDATQRAWSEAQKKGRDDDRYQRSASFAEP
jgi:hypothetical protein